MNTRNIAMLMCTLCISLPAAGQYPLANRVPAESIGYIGWAGRSLTFDGSMVGQLLNEPALTSMLGALRQVTVENSGPQSQAVEHAWDIAGIAWQHPIAIAVLPPAEAGPPMPNPVMIVDLGEDRESFAEHLDGMLAAFEAEVEEVPLGPLTCKMVQTDGPPLVFAYVEDLLVVAMDPELILQISQLAEEESLQAEPKFIDAMAAVAGDDMQLAAYVDFTAVRETINSFMPPPPEEAEPGEPGPEGAAPAEAEPEFVQSGPPAIFNSRDIHSFWRALGVAETTALAYSTRIVDRQLYTKVRLLSPGPHRGYLMLFAGQPITDEDLAGLPADADLVAVANISPTDVLAEVRRSVAEIWPVFGQEGTFEESFDEAMAEFQEEFGLSFEDDVIASLGDTWVLSSAASQGGFLTGTVLSVEVTDPGKLAEVIARIEEVAGGLPELDETGQPVYRPGGMQVRTLQAEQTEIHYLAGDIDGTPSPIAPAWAIHEGRLYFAFWPQVLMTVFDRPPAQLLATDETFQAYRARVADEPTMLFYLNTPSVVRNLYGWLLMGGTMGVNFLSDEGIAADPTWIPSLAAIEKYLSPEISAVSADDEGITIENFAALPMMSDTPSTAGAMTAMALPALHHVRQQARRAASMANLRGIGMACLAYDAEHLRLPENLAALIDDELIIADMLRCPHNDSPPPTVEDRQLIGESDYVYVGGATPAGAPWNTVLAYERPEYYRGEGTAVLFADGHVEFLSMDEFERALTATEAANAETASGE